MFLRRKNKDLLGFNDIPLALFGIVAVSFIMPLLFYGGSLDQGIAAFWPKWKVSMFFTAIYWVTVRQAVILYRRLYPAYKDTAKRLILLVVTVVALVFVINYSCFDVHKLLVPDYPLAELTSFDYAKSTFLIVFLVTSIYEGIYFYHRWRLSMIETERLRKENLSSQLDALRNQVNPHFLFNSLNTLTYLIPEDSERAVRFVQQLSKVYRYILEIRNRSLITLAEELDFLEAYLFLVRERFGDNIKIELKVDPALHQFHLVPLSMQMLLENAIKHNIISKEQPLLIEIIANSQRNVILVRNRLQPKQQQQRSTQVGLNNIRSRYAFYTNASVEVSSDIAGWFSVQLPLLEVLEPQQLDA